MAKRKLTDSFIRNYPNPDRRTELYDSVVDGLAIRITPKGHKSFVYRYRFGNSVKRYTIGSFTAVSLAKARSEAKDLSYKVSGGTDPMAEKQHSRKQATPVTFANLADDYVEIELTTLRADTRREYSRIIENELKPSMGKYPIRDFPKDRVIALLDRIAVKRGKPTMANRIRARLHTIFEFAKGRGLIEHNPITSIKRRKNGETRRDRYYNSDEIRLLWQAFDRQPEPQRSVLKMLLVCGQRSKETRHMRWDNIRDGIWTIPGELAKSERAHEVPLPDMAIEIIDEISPLNSRYDYVFNSPRVENHPIGRIKRAVEEIRTETGITDFTLHDLRRTVATHIAGLGVDRTVLGKIVNHKGMSGDGQVTAIYDRHDYLNEKRQALQKWSDYLRQIIAGEQTKIYKIGGYE